MSLAGASALREGNRIAELQREPPPKRLLRALPSLALLGLSLAVLVEWDLYVAGLVAVVGSVKIARRSRPSVPQEAATWFKGGSGEQTVGNLLQPLEALGWLAVHDRAIPGREENIDHIVVSPGGVFVIETKNYSSKITVGRRTISVGGRNEQKILEQAKREALAAYKVVQPVIEPLGLRVRPVVCFIGAVKDQGARRVAGVEVVSSSELVAFLGAQPKVLTARQIETIGLMLDRLLHAA